VYVENFHNSSGNPSDAQNVAKDIYRYNAGSLR